MTKKTVYIAEDGSEHDTERKCEHRNKLLEAAAQLNEVTDALTALLKERAKTADGETLAELMEDRDGYFYFRDTFYSITEPFYGVPQVEKVYFYPHHLDVDIENERITLREHKQYSTGKYDWHFWRVDELYASREAAERAALEIAENKLAEWTDEVQALRERYGS